MLADSGCGLDAPPRPPELFHLAHGPPRSAAPCSCYACGGVVATGRGHYHTKQRSPRPSGCVGAWRRDGPADVTGRRAVIAYTQEIGRALATVDYHRRLRGRRKLLIAALSGFSMMAGISCLRLGGPAKARLNGRPILACAGRWCALPSLPWRLQFAFSRYPTALPCRRKRSHTPTPAAIIYRFAHKPGGALAVLSLRPTCATPFKAGAVPRSNRLSRGATRLSHSFRHTIAHNCVYVPRVSFQ
jgi:hypothetical protein